MFSGILSASGIFADARLGHADDDCRNCDRNCVFLFTALSFSTRQLFVTGEEPTRYRERDRRGIKLVGAVFHLTSMAQLFASTRKKKSSSRRRRRRRAQAFAVGLSLLIIIVLAIFVRVRVDKKLRCLAHLGVCEGENHFIWRTMADPSETNVVALLTGNYLGQKHPNPPAVGRKYHSSGRVLGNQGTSVLCRIDAKSEAFKDLTQIQDSLKLQPFADAFEFLPPNTFHVTLASLVSNEDRGSPRWPKYVPRVKPMPDIVQEFKQRLQGLKGPKHFRLKPTAVVGALAVVLQGASRDETSKVRNMRWAIYDAVKVREHWTEQSRYVFHVSLGYLVRWLTDEEALAVHEFSQMMAERWVATNPVLTIGPPELCKHENVLNFSTVYRFQ